MIKTHVAQENREKRIWTPLCVSVHQTVIGDKIKMHGKINLNITFKNITYHVAYVADSDKFILGLDFMKENSFKLDFKNNEQHSRSGDMAVFNTKNSELEPVYQVIAKSEITILSRSPAIVSRTITKENIFRYVLIEYPDSNYYFTFRFKKCNYDFCYS